MPLSPSRRQQSHSLTSALWGALPPAALLLPGNTPQWIDLMNTELLTQRSPCEGRVDQENEFLNDLLLYAHATGTPLDIAFVDDSAAANSTKTSPFDPATAPAEETHQPNDDLASESDRPT